ncbi:MAG: apolipoprotein N-acyltransferase [Planctomycetota bacterium]
MTHAATSRTSTIGRGLLAGLAAASFWLLAFPWPFAGASSMAMLGPLAWYAGLLAPLPIVWIGWTAPRRWLAGLAVGVGTVPLWAVHHAWVRDVSFAGVFPLIAYLAVWPMLAVVGLSLARRATGGAAAALVIPTIWVGLEFIRGEILFGGYAWFLAGQPMIEFLPLARSASVGGVYAVSWLVVAVSGIAVGARERLPEARRSMRTGWIATAVLAGAISAGLLVRPGGPSGRAVPVAAVQTNVAQNNKIAPTREQVRGDFIDLLRLIEQAAEAGAHVIITPETVFQGLALDDDGAERAAAMFGSGVNGFRDALLDTQRALGRSILIGSLTREGLRLEPSPDGEVLAADATYNSLYLLAGGAVTQPRYDKLRPTPFGETLPYIDAFPWLRDIVLRIGLGASGFDFGLDRGGEPRALVVPTPSGDVHVATPICFESSMAPVVRSLVRADEKVELLVVVTNDGWFGRFHAGRAMHLLMGRWRCVEHALPMVRSANTGFSAVIDRDGRVRASLGAGVEGVLAAEVSIGGGGTVYAAVGEVPGAVCAVLAVALSVAGAVRGARRGGREPVTADEEGTDDDE